MKIGKNLKRNKHMSAKTLIPRPARGQWNGITLTAICCPCDDEWVYKISFESGLRFSRYQLRFTFLSTLWQADGRTDRRTNRPKNYIPRNFSLAIQISKQSVEQFSSYCTVTLISRNLRDENGQKFKTKQAYVCKHWYPARHVVNEMA